MKKLLNDGMHHVEDFILANELKSYHKIYQLNRKSYIKIYLLSILGIILVIMLLPWTQNIKADGKVTTLQQFMRPQEIHALISGRIEKWYHKEGDFVQKGDTLLVLSEIKSEYLDPELLTNTKNQMRAKESSMTSYYQKVQTVQQQKTAMEKARKAKLSMIDNKIQQQYLKIKNDSAELNANQIELGIYQRQINAAEKMYQSGAISLVEFEKRKVNYRNSIAKNSVLGNKLLQDQQELNSLFLEKNAVDQDFTDKLAKAEGELFGALSSAASTEAEVVKLKNIYNNYSIRSEMYVIRAPQTGQVVSASKAGIGEIVKDGEKIMDIVPDHNEFAVEMFIDPFDLPLIQLGQKVRFVFDGFPAIVFSGWPKNSSGTFGGVVTVIEGNISDNGKFRILVAPDSTDHPWPRTLRIGGGAKGIALLKDVRVFYELWRNINGFPPEYYKVEKKQEKGTKK